MASGSFLVVAPAMLGVFFAFWLFTRKLSKISLNARVPRSHSSSSMSRSDVDEASDESLVRRMETGSYAPDALANLRKIYRDIQEGAQAFLAAEYRMCVVFLVGFGAPMAVLVSNGSHGFDGKVGFMTAFAFLAGGVTSMLSGYVGMMVATYTNARCAIMASMAPESTAWKESFNAAFRGGGVMGFALSGLGLLVMYVLMVMYSAAYSFEFEAMKLFECIAGFGLGGSAIAMFGRVGGGIYTKAADVGADLAGKVVAGIPEDDPRNPATIADNVGDNVGDVAGMGSDLFGSFAEATCAALVIGAQSADIVAAGWDALIFPLYISSVGIIVCIAVSFVATDIQPVRNEASIERVLKMQLTLSTVAMTICMYPICLSYMPYRLHLGADSFDKVCVGSVSSKCVTNGANAAFACIAAGLWGGLIIGFVTEYFTSHSYYPVRELAKSTETGAATNIIYGLALGYKSTIVPVGVLAFGVMVSFSLMDMYGVALCALGMLGTLSTCLSIDVYGPICDNAGGIAEMAGMPDDVREKTDALDAAGNTTAAIGKGFAIGSAALVSLALTAAFVTRSGALEDGVNLLNPSVFAFLLIGSMLPYWFSAMTMKSVGIAAMEMVKEVKRQFDTIPGLLEGTPGHAPPDHARCIKISTDASLREMVPPAALVILAPIVTGTFFGVRAVTGLLAGGLASGVQLAISASNTGGAWDNAKKFVEKGGLYIDVPKRERAHSDPVEGPYTGAIVRNVDGSPQMVSMRQRKGSECHKAAVVGDTVGDPLKDTSGPAVNILMKLSAIISLVFCDFFMSINGGRGVFLVGN
jgi:inorganic pyrophosphatase|tara:strand:+ start:29533 stop:31959 length:2427 start_codon:yes stop_codon:yes gene_type:complete